MHPPNIHQENPDSKYSQIEQKGYKSDSLVAMKKVTKVTPTQRMWRRSNLRKWWTNKKITKVTGTQRMWRGSNQNPVP